MYFLTFPCRGVHFSRRRRLGGGCGRDVRMEKKGHRGQRRHKASQGITHASGIHHGLTILRLEGGVRASAMVRNRLSTTADFRRIIVAGRPVPVRWGVDDRSVRSAVAHRLYLIAEHPGVNHDLLPASSITAAISSDRPLRGDGRGKNVSPSLPGSIIPDENVVDASSACP